MIGERLAPYLRRDETAQGGALVVFLGVPEAQVAGQPFTHHQLLQDYARPLGNGNNMFVSVSAPGDEESAPAGHRAVMISTHCELDPWENLPPDAYQARKRAAGEALVALARRVYPSLGENALVYEVATPRTYLRYVRRPRGAVGGVRQTLAQHEPARHPPRARRARLLAGRRHHLAGPRHGRLRARQPHRRRRRPVPRTASRAERTLFPIASGGRDDRSDRHETPAAADMRLPTLRELGDDLLVTTPRQRWVALARPFIGVALYALAWALGLWWLSPLIVFLIFVAVVTVTHDVVHGTLGLNRRQTDWALFLTGLVLLESGHAYRTTHLQHHKVFPSDDDPEGYPAKISLLGAVLYGPVFLARLWFWAFQRNARRPAQRVWLLVEALMPPLAIVGGVLLWSRRPRCSSTPRSPSSGAGSIRC